MVYNVGTTNKERRYEKMLAILGAILTTVGTVIVVVLGGEDNKK